MHRTPPNQSSNLGVLIAGLARVGIAGAQGIARRSPAAPSGKGGKSSKGGGCTPCAAMARKQAAIAARKGV